MNYTLTPNLSIQTYAEPFVSAGALHELQGARRRRARRVRRSLCAVCLRRQRRLQLPLVPHDQRAALGVQAGLGALRRLAAGPPGRRRRYGDFQFGRDFRRRLLGAVAQRLPGEVLVLAEYVAGVSQVPGTRYQVPGCRAVELTSAVFNVSPQRDSKVSSPALSHRSETVRDGEPVRQRDSLVPLYRVLVPDRPRSNG